MPALTLYPYQRRWLKDASRFKIASMARQIGKTFATTLEIVDDCLDAEVAGRRARWVILSRGERQAKEAMEENIHRHLKAYETAFEALEDEWIAEGGAKYKALEVRFPRGSRITALPANADTARGFSANVFLDEFAFHQDSKSIWSALFPVISAPGLKLRVVSTPNGKGNKFFELMTGTDTRWSRHRVTIHDAVRDGLNRDVAELREGIADEDSWQQEYELDWLDGASAWLPYDLISSVEHNDAGDPAKYGGGPCFIGNDIAVKRDLWCAWVIEVVSGVLWTREIRTLRRATFAEQDAVLDELMGRYRVARLAMDKTGIGEKPCEDACRRYGAHRVEGVHFSPASKYLLATTAKSAFEDRKIRIPLGDQKVRSDLHKVVKTVSATGAPILSAERDGDGHADRAWACFLACYAASAPVQELDFHSAGPREGAALYGAEDANDEIELDDEGFGAVGQRLDLGGYA